MMRREIALLDVVELKNPDPKHSLLPGQVGTVVEILAPGVFEVEFSDDAGRTIALAAFRADRLSLSGRWSRMEGISSRRRSHKLEDIEGIGPAYAAKLRGAGVGSIGALLTAGGTAKGRKNLAAKSGIGETNILEWVNRADLFRVKGVGEEYSDLLEAVGVDSVVELSKRNAAHLHAAMTTLNAEKKLVRRVPPEASVAAWIEHAKTLPRAVSH